MKNNLILLLFVIVFTLFIVGCGTRNNTVRGNGDVISQERTAINFTGIVHSSVANIEIHPSNAFRVIVTTDSNIQDIVLIEVNNNLLNISMRSNTNVNNITKLTVDIYLPELAIIRSSGVGSINVSSGSSSNLEIVHSGVGNIDAQNFQVENIIITHSGVGRSSVWATSSLSGTLSGVGSIRYRGSPTVNVSRTGVGSISQL